MEKDYVRGVANRWGQSSRIMPHFLRQLFLFLIQLHVISCYRSRCMVLFILLTVEHVLRFFSCLSLMPCFTTLRRRRRYCSFFLFSVELDPVSCYRSCCMTHFALLTVCMFNIFVLSLFNTMFTIIRFEEEEEDTVSSSFFQ